MKVLMMAMLLGTLSGHSLTGPMGSCEFDSAIAGVAFNGRLFQCRLEQDSTCTDGVKLHFSRGRADMGGREYVAESGSMCIPKVGAVLKKVGMTTWVSGNKKLAVGFELATTMVTEKAITANIRTTAHLVVDLRGRK